MAINKKTKIVIDVNLDKNKIPEQIKWTAEDGGVYDMDAKAILLSFWDSKNQEYFRVQDYTWKEHYNRAPDIIKWSPTLRSIYATGKNIGEWATRKGWTYDSKTGTVNDGQGNNVGERDLMNAASADAPYVASGTPTKSAPDSMAAKWFNQLGGSAGNFNLTSAFADAKAKQQQILGNTTPVGLLAAGNTPYFDFLQKHSLTKGIL